MSNIVIFTGSTGAGHTLAARSLKEALDEKGHNVTIIDGFKKSGKFLSTTIEKGYKDLVEYLPELYRRVYQSFDKPSPYYDLTLSALRKYMQGQLIPEIKKLNPDLVVSTHPLVTNVLGQLKEENALPYPVLAFVTDFKIHEAYINPSIDAYVVATPYTKESMRGKGIMGDRIYPYGIPVRPEFKEHKDLRDPDVFSILLMGGSLGSSQMKKTLKSLLKAQVPLKIRVVCGTNKKLRKSITELLTEYPSYQKDVYVYGFVDDISGLMDQSDVLITKPGGLTASEAITKNIPMIIAYAYPGQEEENAQYLVEMGMALLVAKPKELGGVISFLTRNRYILNNMRRIMREVSDNQSIDKTVALCEKLASGEAEEN